QALHAWRHSGRAGGSGGRLGAGFADRTRRAHHRPARRLPPGGHAGRPARARESHQVRLAGIHGGSPRVRQRRQAGGKRPRRLFHAARLITGAIMATSADNLGTVLDATALAAPDRIALVDLDAGESARTWTYAQLRAAACRVATAMRARGYAPGDRIAIVAANSAHYLAALLGIQRAGLVPVPVNFKFPPETIAYILRDSGSRLVLHDAARAGGIP